MSKLNLNCYHSIIRQLKYSKSYKNHTEEAHRMEVFKENVNIIEKHNQRYEKGEILFKMAINRFSDLTHDEFYLLMNGKPSVDNFRPK